MRNEIYIYTTHNLVKLASGGSWASALLGMVLWVIYIGLWAWSGSFGPLLVLLGPDFGWTCFFLG